MEEIILKELKKLLVDTFGDIIEDVILFGSRARGTFHEDSDYDILVILNKDYDWQLSRKISDACYEIDLKYDVFTDVEVVSLNELKNSPRGAHPVFQKAISTGIHA
jgi:predicted nucleotidyltransferase